MVWEPDPLSSPFVLPVWLLPLSFPHATVSQISQGPGFIKASLLLPAAFCYIPDNKPEMGPLPDTHRDEEETTAHAWRTDKRYQHWLCATTHMDLCAQTPTRTHAWTQQICHRLSVFCSDNYRNEGWMMKCRMIGRGGENCKKIQLVDLKLKSWQLCHCYAYTNDIKIWLQNPIEKRYLKTLELIRSSVANDTSVGTIPTWKTVVHELCLNFIIS